MRGAARRSLQRALAAERRPGAFTMRRSLLSVAYQAAAPTEPPPCSDHHHTPNPHTPTHTRRMYENKTVPVEHPNRFRVEILFSPGTNYSPIEVRRAPLPGLQPLQLARCRPSRALQALPVLACACLCLPACMHACTTPAAVRASLCTRQPSPHPARRSN
jgi:hypothetical protein